MNCNGARGMTMRAIRDSSEYKIIMKRISMRASIGYNYIKIDDEIDNILNKFSIRDYLIHEGYTIRLNVIEWNF